MLRNKYMHIVRSAAGCISVPKIGNIFSDAEALSIAEALPWEQLVAIERLRYACRLLQHAPQCLMALLEQLSVHKSSWTRLIFSDLEWMHGLVGKHFDMPPITSPADLVG